MEDGRLTPPRAGRVGWLRWVVTRTRHAPASCRLAPNKPSTRILAGLARAALCALGLLSLGRLPALGAEPRARPAPLVDLHVDLPYQHVFQGRDFASGSGQYRALELLRAGVVGVVLPLFVPARVSPSGPRLSDLEGSYQRVFDALTRTPPYALPGCLASRQSVRTFLAFEGAAPLLERQDSLVEFVARGVRSIGLVHTRDNRLAASSQQPSELAGTPAGHKGLTTEGVDLVERAVRLRVAVDVSHASDATVREVAELVTSARVPMLATHSNSRVVRNHPRNLADAEALAIARSGEVVGVNLHSPFLVAGRRARIADVVRHVRYWVRVLGVEHVGIGSDFEGDIRPPEGLESVADLPKLALALEQSGLSRAAVEQIFGLNALRILCPPSER
ncbi:MAG TPA: membrane dipeptidase [Polyangiaceae bacterium]|nr:membrane dipeptidase [Polyangiaceae bacterium]